jgi:small subunit ribosomal protein S1
MSTEDNITPGSNDGGDAARSQGTADDDRQGQKDDASLVSAGQGEGAAVQQEVSREAQANEPPMPPGDPSSTASAPTATQSDEQASHASTTSAERPATPAESPAQPSPDAEAAGEAAPVAPASGPSPQDEPGDDVGNRMRTNRVPDDIGNRLPGAQGPRRDEQGGPARAEGPAGEGGPGKKKRRRRRRKGAAGTGPEGLEAGAEGAEAAEGAEGAEAEGAEGEEGSEPGAEGEGGEAAGKRKLRKKGIPPLRERPAFQVGEEVFGKVAKVTEHAIWIDIAGKAMGLFDRREIIDEEPPVEGDQFIATVASTGVRGGMLVMSRASARLEEARQRVEAALETGEYIDGFVTGAVKGGLEVDIGGLRAFAPASHVDLKHGADLNYLVGQRLEFQVSQYAKKGRDIVVSRKKLLEDVAWAERAQWLTKLEPGTVHKGVVRTVMAWGVFVALPEFGNVEGLVHMTEASHDRTAKLMELFKPGDEVDVKILKIDDNGKLWLSRKACVEDPWAAVKEKYSIGSRHKGKVARLQPFGAFIELEQGIDGLIHTADLSLKLISHPSDVVKVGDELDVVVASCDSGMHRIGLHPAPPAGEENEPRQKIAPHKPLSVVVHQITEGGLVVRVLGVTGRLARAFIPAGHTGTQRGTDLRKTFPIGTRLEAKVIDVDPRRGEAKLSIRALKEDAEKQAFQQYRTAVARESKFGTFADLMKNKS